MERSLIERLLYYQQVTVLEGLWLVVSVYGVVTIARSWRRADRDLDYLLDTRRNGARLREARAERRRATGRLVIMCIFTLMGVLAVLSAPVPSSPFRPISSVLASLLIVANTIMVYLDRADQRDHAALVAELLTRQAAIDSTHDAIISIDRESRIVAINDTAQAMFGYRAGELLGRSLTMLMPERYRPLHLAGIARYLETGESRVLGKPFTAVGLRRDGTEMPLTTVVTALGDDDAASFTAIMRPRTPAEETSDRHVEMMEALVRQEALLEATQGEATAAHGKAAEAREEASEAREEASEAKVQSKAAHDKADVVLSRIDEAVKERREGC